MNLRRLREDGLLKTLRNQDPVIVGLWISLVLVLIIWMIPFIFMVFTSLKTRGELMTGSPFALPEQWVFENYADAWERGNLVKYGLNSMLIAFTKVPLGLFLASLAAYGFARLRLPFNRLVFLLVVMGTLIPIQVALGPLFRIILGLGLLNSYVGILLPYIAFGVPYQIFILHGFFRNIPFELDEAAYMDGASAFGVYWRIILPLATPAMAALFILDFVATWNEFAIALVILQSKEAWTIPLGLMSFQGQFGIQYHQLNAAIVMSILPVLIVYMLFQRYFVQGLTAGAVKG